MTPPADRFVCRFAAEPSQDPLPYGRREEALAATFLDAVAQIDAEGEDLGEPTGIAWYPDRTWDGRTFQPATARTTTGLELFGYVWWPAGEPETLGASADFTDLVADAHPEWQLDLNEEVVGRWRGDPGHQADMTLVWGVPLVPGGAIATAELAGLAVDQCPLEQGRFTLLAPDDYRQDTLEVHLWDARGGELACESLYTEDE